MVLKKIKPYLRVACILSLPLVSLVLNYLILGCIGNMGIGNMGIRFSFKLSLFLVNLIHVNSCPMLFSNSGLDGLGLYVSNIIILAVKVY